MHPSLPLFLIALAATCRGEVPATPSLIPAFSGTVRIANPLPRIPIPGGVRTGRSLSLLAGNKEPEPLSTRPPARD